MSRPDPAREPPACGSPWAAAVAAPERSVRVGDLLLCSAAACYRARTPGYATVADTAAGKASVVADVTIPATTVTDVYFTDVSGNSVMQGHLKLETPLAIAGDFPAVELMLGLRRQQAGKQAAYVPVQSAHMVFADDSELVHYLPSVRTVAALSLGTSLTIPAGALAQPRIFNVGITKVGELFPKIDILLYVNLKKPGIIEVRALRSASAGGAEREAIVPVDPAGRSDDLVAAPAERRLARLAFSRTAMIEPLVLEKSAGAGGRITPPPSAASAAPKTCAEYLAQPIVLGTINLVALKTGAARVLACEKVKPFVHIVYAFLTTRSVRDVAAGSRDVASSSTSVIKNGVCQTPGTPSRWSAVGAFNGHMVLISSTSRGQTEAAELCAVFRALAIKDALRLDGGPSAALMVSGELLNPLEGWDRAKFGQSRRIPYPLRISH